MLWPTSTLASPLECALAKNAPATPLEYALAKSLDLKFPGINTYKKGWGILAGRDAGATKSFPPPFHLLPLTVCLLRPRGSTELTTAVTPPRLSFRGPTFSVGPRNLSERSLARRVRLGMMGEKKIALRWLLPLTVCLLPPRDSTELTTTVTPPRLSFRGSTFSVGPRNLSERSLARRVWLGMTGQRKIAFRWQATAFMRSALALGDTKLVEDFVQ